MKFPFVKVFHFLGPGKRQLNSPVDSDGSVLQMLNDPCLLCFSGASSQDLCLLRIPNPENPFTSSSLGWCINTTSGTSVVVQWLKFCLSRQGLKVRLVEQLRSHMPQALPPKNETTIKQKQYYCNIFNKDFF